MSTLVQTPVQVRESESERPPVARTPSNEGGARTPKAASNRSASRASQRSDKAANPQSRDARLNVIRATLEELRATQEQGRQLTADAAGIAEQTVDVLAKARNARQTYEHLTAQTSALHDTLVDAMSYMLGIDIAQKLLQGPQAEEAEAGEEEEVEGIDEEVDPGDEIDGAQVETEL